MRAPSPACAWHQRLRGLTRHTQTRLLAADGTTYGHPMAPQAAAASRRRKKSAEAPVVASVRVAPTVLRQWRVCFVWEDELGPTDVEIVDYH